jgi:hypothetical protein
VLYLDALAKHNLDRDKFVLENNLIALSTQYQISYFSTNPNMASSANTHTDSTNLSSSVLIHSQGIEAGSRDPSADTTLPASALAASPSPTVTQGDSLTSSEVQRNISNDDDTITAASDDPYALRDSKRADVTRKSILIDYPQSKSRKIKKYYNRQNALIDAYLGSADEEALEHEDALKNGGKVKFAIYGSSTVNFFLFIIQMYAAVSTGSLSLFGTAADAFVGSSQLDQ